MDDALASLTPQQRETIALLAQQDTFGHPPLRLVSVIRDEYGTVGVIWKRHNGEERVTVVHVNGETSYSGPAQEMGQFETLYEWPKESE